jgi:large subunit ribosomal protein L10
MTREEKSQVIQDLTAVLAGANTLYLADISGLNAQTTSNLRRACFKAVKRNRWEVVLASSLYVC